MEKPASVRRLNPRSALRAVENADDFAALLKHLRVQAGLSQQTLAERASISVQAVSALERGYRKAPYRATLARIADALELSPEARQRLERSTERSRGPRHTEHLPARAHNLPRQITSFLGRDEVLAKIEDLVASAPLVSIVGTGGAGKSRAAIEVGYRSLSRFPDGVCFVELAPLNDRNLVTRALAEALRVQESTHRSLFETLSAYLAHKQILIILDNCEHVVSQARQLAGSLLRECPNLALLATSREALNITGERAYRIPSLAVPERGLLLPEQAASYGAVALFVDRVRAADASFELNSENVQSVIEICRRLDGLPLALELAAARASVLSPQQICNRLDRVFDVLSEHLDVGVPRHATMRAVIDWSYDLLSSQAQLLFERLAIFAGGFTLENATTICSGDGVFRKNVLEALSSLVAQSLVMVEFAHGAARYHLQEATRQYAVEKLVKRGAQHAQAQRHALAFLEIAARLDKDWYDAPERSWFIEAESEIDNFRAALGWSLGERNALRAGRLLAGALARLWYSLAPVEGRYWVRLAIDSITEETRADELAQLYIAEAELCGALGESAASLASAEQALRMRSVLGELQLARAEHAAGSAFAAIGKSSKAEALLQKALSAAERLENRRLQALVLSDLGTVHSRRGDVDGARRFYAEALTRYVCLGLERPAASIAGHLAEVEFEAGDPAAALHQAEEARAGHAATRNRRSEATDLSNITAYLVALDCFDDARSYARQALTAARDVRSPVLTAYVLQHIAAIAALQSLEGEAVPVKDLEEAAMLVGFVDARLRTLGAQRDYTERQERERVAAALGHALGKRCDELVGLGAQWSEEVAATVALDL